MSVRSPGGRVDAGRLRVGVVGLGPWGMEHLRAWQAIPAATVVAICDRDELLLHQVGASFGIARKYTRVDEMAAGADLDVVSIVAGEADRLETASPFFAAGVHALVEKPLGLDMASARNLIDAARRAEVLVMTGHVLRFDPRFVVLKQRIDDGTLGAVRSVYARRLNLKSAHHKYRRAHTALMAQIHDIDLACWYFGASPLAVQSRELSGPDRPELPRVLWTILEFADGIAVLEHAWALPDEGGVWLESETEVIATEGVARISSPGDAIEVLAASGHFKFDPAYAAVADPHPAIAVREQLSYLAGCVLDGVEPKRLTTDDAMTALQTAFAVIEAATSGETVNIRRDGDW